MFFEDQNFSYFVTQKEEAVFICDLAREEPFV